MMDNREKIIVRTSIVGILANILLAAFKAFVGIIANSIAVTLDAVNNLSDAVSSVITIVGTKLSGKAPDKKHPYGYGRIEYLTQMVIAAIVLYAGLTALVESIKKIINPVEANYSRLAFVIIGAAVIVKLLLGLYVKKKGKEVNSGSLTASGKDALFDSILSVSVLASAIIHIVFHINLEAYVGVIISLIIIKSGFEMIRDAIDEIIGNRSEVNLSKSIKKTIAEDAEVHGAYDLFINNYGPDRYLASAHVEVNDTMTASQIDAMTRRVQERVYKEHAVMLVALGIYSVNTANDFSAQLQEKVRQYCMEEGGVLQIHGFYVDIEAKKISFDMVIEFRIEDRNSVIERIKKKIEAEYPEYEVYIALDIDISD